MLQKQLFLLDSIKWRENGNFYLNLWFFSFCFWKNLKSEIQSLNMNANISHQIISSANHFLCWKKCGVETISTQKWQKFTIFTKDSQRNASNIELKWKFEVFFFLHFEFLEFCCSILSLHSMSTISSFVKNVSLGILGGTSEIKLRHLISEKSPEQPLLNKTFSWVI